MAFRMARGSVVLCIPYEEENVYDETLRTMLQEVMAHFNGFHDVFKINEKGFTCSRAILNTCIFDWSMIALRIQYVYLFVSHFPIDAPKTDHRMKFVYKEFVSKIKLLHRQINSCARVKYIMTIDRLIHLTEILAFGMHLNQIPWHGCCRCMTPYYKPLWRKNPVIKCLSEVQLAAPNVVARHVGIPSECRCPSGNYHFPQEKLDENEQPIAE